MADIGGTVELEEPGGMIMYELKSHTAFQGEAEQRGY